MMNEAPGMNPPAAAEWIEAQGLLIEVELLDQANHRKGHPSPLPLDFELEAKGSQALTHRTVQSG